MTVCVLREFYLFYYRSEKKHRTAFYLNYLLTANPS